MVSENKRRWGGAVKGFSVARNSAGVGGRLRASTPRTSLANYWKGAKAPLQIQREEIFLWTHREGGERSEQHTSIMELIWSILGK